MQTSHHSRTVPSTAAPSLLNLSALIAQKKAEPESTSHHTQTRLERGSNQSEGSLARYN